MTICVGLNIAASGRRNDPVEVGSEASGPLDPVELRTEPTVGLARGGARTSAKTVFASSGSRQHCVPDAPGYLGMCTSCGVCVSAWAVVAGQRVDAGGRKAVAGRRRQPAVLVVLSRCRLLG